MVVRKLTNIGEEYKMGFDIYGEKPDNDTGEYFRNNVWWWRPMGNLIKDLCGHILSTKQREQVHTNDGCLFNKKTALEICDILESHNFATWKHIAVGSTKDIEVIINRSKRDGDEKFEYPYSDENVKEFIDFARHSGGFRIC